MENREEPKVSSENSGLGDGSGSAGPELTGAGIREPKDEPRTERAPGSSAEPGSAPSLEETLGLGGGGRRADKRSGLEQISAALGDVFLGGGRGGGWRAGERVGGFFASLQFWGWRGAWPLLIGVAIGAGMAAAPPVQRAVGDGIERMRAAMLSRPEFAIRKLEVVGMRNLSEQALKDAVQAGGPERSAFAFDYDGARRRIEALGWVERASVVLQAPNTLAIEIVERRPVALWRRGKELSLIDPSGVLISPVRARVDHSQFPLLVGPGAAGVASEALDLARIAKAGGFDVAAFTRVGQRRWDLEMRGGVRLMLPEHAPRQALEKAVKLARTSALFERGFEIVDLRLPFAPTARPRPKDG